MYLNLETDQHITTEINLDLISVGFVQSVGDGVVKITGLMDIEAGAVVKITSSYNGEFFRGMVLNLEYHYISVVLFGTDRFICPGDVVVREFPNVCIGVGSSLLGRVIDTLGNPIDGLGNCLDLITCPVDIKAPGIIARESVKESLQTGIKAVDSMIPIGRGQRELIIGDRGTGKTTVAVNTMLMQAIDNLASSEIEVKNIYVGIGLRRSSIINLVEILEKYEALSKSIILSATSSEAAALQYLAPYAACRIGEFFRDNFAHSLIIYDDLSKHAVAYRQLSLLLRRPPGREAYPGDVFYLHSRLLERAAKLNNICDSGSLTALPVIETQKGDVSAYIPTNVISITDGQIFLETELFYNGIRPAINVGVSVSRVGSAAQNPVLKKVSSSIRFDLAQYRAVALLGSLSSDLDPTTKFQIHRGIRLVEILKQRPYRPFMVEQQIIILYAVMNGFFDTITVSNVLKFEQKLLVQLTSNELVLVHFVTLNLINFDLFGYYLENIFLTLLQKV